MGIGVYGPAVQKFLGTSESGRPRCHQSVTNGPQRGAIDGHLAHIRRDGSQRRSALNTPTNHELLGRF